MSDNCYLIRHGAEWLLRDSGYSDALTDKPVTTPVGLDQGFQKPGDIEDRLRSSVGQLGA